MLFRLKIVYYIVVKIKTIFARDFARPQKAIFKPEKASKSNLERRHESE